MPVISAALFDKDGNLVGRDCSPPNSLLEIESVHHQIFADHLTATVVGKIRSVRRPQLSRKLRRSCGKHSPRPQWHNGPIKCMCEPPSLRRATRPCVSSQRPSSFTNSHISSTNISIIYHSRSQAVDPHSTLSVVSAQNHNSEGGSLFPSSWS